LRRFVARRKSELCETNAARDVFKEIDFFQNGYIDSYSIYEFVKYYMQRELDPLASTFVIEQFAASEQRVDLEAFVGYFQPQVGGILTPTASSVASIDLPEPVLNRPSALGKIKKNSPQRGLQRYKSEDRFKPILRDNDSVLDRSDSFERLKERSQHLKKKLGRIPERYRAKRYHHTEDSQIIDKQLEESDHKNRTNH